MRNRKTGKISSLNISNHQEGTDCWNIADASVRNLRKMSQNTNTVFLLKKMDFT